MSGNNYNKGQVLLITVMLLATALTIALSVAFTSKTETQITKLEEESQKALAAAEAGIEALLKSSSNTIDISSLGIGFSGAASIDVSYDKKTFITPILQKDEQYTFYLSDYPGLNNLWSGTLTIYFKTESGCPAIEIARFDVDDSITRDLVDPCGNITNSATGGLTAVAGGSLEGESFSYKIPLSVSNQKLLLVRILSSASKIGFEGSSNLKLQGKYVTSTATSEGGSTKKVELFQSYPQIPTEFIIPTF
jgi:hypothetical protein